jgi:hypothetical protein
MHISPVNRWSVDYLTGSNIRRSNFLEEFEVWSRSSLPVCVFDPKEAFERYP